MSPDRERRRPMRLHPDPQTSAESSGFRALTFYLINGRGYTFQVPENQAAELLDELRATWRHEVYNSFSFGSLETGSMTLINPAHIASVDVR
jgi:hypothetical protein